MPEDRGLYVCTAENVAGQAQVAAILEVERSSHGRTIGLNLKRPLELGGVGPNVRVAPGVGMDTGFHGCIGEVILKGHTLNVVDDAIASSNIVDCGDETPCVKRPCTIDGQCIEVSSTEYRCNCPAQYTGLEGKEFSFVEGKSGGVLRMLNTRGNIYIGVMPNLDGMTFGQHEKMLKGCVSNLYIQGKGPVDLTSDAVRGVNIMPCST